MRPKPICSLSLDLDNQWSYMKTHGDAGWQDYPSYLDIVVPRFLEVLADFGWTITVFIVGQDAAFERNHEALRMITDAGHEVGNHSFNHEPWLHLYNCGQFRDELSRAEEAIEEATGMEPRGFRGPGYSLSGDVIRVLTARRYIFDASTLPTFLGPLARAYYFMTSSFSQEERERRNLLFGKATDGFQPLQPYWWQSGDSQLLEIPVTTFPILKIPFHFSYIHYLGLYSESLALLYFRSALRLCRALGVEPSLLLHPLDFLGGDDIEALSFFPAMRCRGRTKNSRVRRLFSLVDASYEVSSMNAHARSLSSRKLAHRPAPNVGNKHEDLGPKSSRSASSGGTKATEEHPSPHKPSEGKSF